MAGFLTSPPLPARREIPGCLSYSSTKAGVICLSKSLAKEVAGRGDITVNSIAPAVVQTHILDTIPKETVDYMVSRIPVGRTGKIEEIAALVHYLVSSGSIVHHGPVLRHLRWPGDILR